MRCSLRRKERGARALLVISDKQSNALAFAAALDREPDLARHLQAFAPAHARSLGAAGLSALIRLGLARAQDAGLRLYGPTRFYIELMVMFGSGFHRDPILPWRHYLQFGAGAGEMDMMLLLHERVQFYRRLVYGEEQQIEHEALSRLLATSVEHWLGAHEDDVWDAVHAVFPQKCDVAGEAAFAALAREASRVLAERGLPNHAGLAALMIGFGVECCEDPQFPWIARSLAGEDPADVRFARLARRTFAFLRAAFAEFGEAPHA